MEFTDTGDNLQVRNRVFLKGPDNYKDWPRATKNKLIAKDVYDVASGLEPYPVLATGVTAADQRQWIKKDQLAWSIIDDVLDRPIHNILPRALADVADSVIRIPIADSQGVTSNVPTAQSFLLLEHLRDTYSANRGSRKVELLRMIWRTDIEENEDPMPTLARMREAHNDLASNAASITSVYDDSLLASAMIIALPPSYTTLVQTLSLRDMVSSADVITAVTDEHRRRSTQESMAQALIAKRAVNTTSQPNTAKPKARGAQLDKWCDYHRSNTHSNAECYVQQNQTANLAKQTPSANRVPSSTLEVPNGRNFFAVAPATALHAFPVDSNDLVIDSGCTTTMVKDRSLLSNLTKLKNPIAITVGNNQVIQAVESGTLHFGSISLPSLLVPALMRNLVSVSQTSALGKWSFDKAGATFSTESQTRVAYAGLDNGLYTLPTGPHSSALIADPISPLMDWHRRYRHLNPDDVIRMGKAERLDGKNRYWFSRQVSEDRHTFQCPACIQGGATRLPTHLRSDRALQPLAVTHIDLFGPTRTTGIHGERYILTIYDDYTRRYHVTGLTDKTCSRVTNALVDYLVNSETQTGCKAKMLRSDRGSEFTGHQFQSMVKSRGLDHALVSPDSHRQNGRIERAIFTIINRGRTYLQDSGLDAKWWPYAAKYATYVLNRSPAGRAKLVPEDRWRKSTTRVDHLRPFGNHLWFRNHTESAKLAPRYIPGRLLGFVDHTTNYIVLNSQTNKATFSRDVIFVKPTTVPKPTVEDSGPASDADPLEVEVDNAPFSDTDKPVITQQPPAPPVRRRLIPVVEIPLRRPRAPDPVIKEHESDTDSEEEPVKELHHSDCLTVKQTQQALIHIDTIYHHLRDEIASGKLDLQYIPSAENLADAFTKSLPQDSHSRLAQKLGLSRRNS